MRAVDSRIRFVVNIDSNIPNALVGDATRIRQVLLNVLSNAFKYTEKGYVLFTVYGELINESMIKLIIEVKDSGIGIKPEDIDKLFDDYVQFDLGINKDLEGTGLGLAITKGIVQAMNGDISVQSEYGKGSTFTITLPQKIRSAKALASVDNPNDKSVIVYERREIYADSLIYSISNLGVKYTRVKSDAEFLENMSSREYAFIFISYALFNKNRDAILTHGTMSKIVVLTEFGEAIPDKNLSVLTMPVYSVLIANVLNGVSNVFNYSESGGFIVRFTAPDAKVLVVDDINTNLRVAEGLLLPYKMNVALCDSGIGAIAMLESNHYDLVFMDHKMPGMDGVETTQCIRKMGEYDEYYKNLPVVALTANAVAGTREMFLENGLNDFLSKPIDTVKLNSILEKWIPKEKQKGSTVEAMESAMPEKRSAIRSVINPEILEVFRQDAEKTIVTLRETMARGDIKLFTTTVHAIKSALANVGEIERSEAASALENAGESGDLDYIKANTESFLQTLEQLVKTLSTAEPEDDTKAPVLTEDRAYLVEQLKIIKSACENYDDMPAYAALDRLKEIPWKKETSAALEAIRDILFLHSDFDKAAELAGKMLNT
jgi:CheY-like chemotaxis protein